MKIHTEQLYPWADVNKAFSTMRKLVVTVGDETHEGYFDLSQDEAGTVTLAFPAPAAPEETRSRKRK